MSSPPPLPPRSPRVPLTPRVPPPRPPHHPYDLAKAADAARANLRCLIASIRNPLSNNKHAPGRSLEIMATIREEDEETS